MTTRVKQLPHQIRGLYAGRVGRGFKKYLFEPRFRFNRIELNGLVVVMLLVGMGAGVYAMLFNVIPGILATNDTYHTWTFSGAQATNYTYDDTLVAVDDGGARPISGVNLFTNPEYVADGSGWQTGTVLGDSTPTGYAVVPGNPDYGTSDFLVAQYEMKYDCTGDGIGDTDEECAAVYSSGQYNVIDWDLTDRDPNNVVSTPEGYPITLISQTQAATVCAPGYHLITNDEWMTIARNIEAQPSNWADGVVGSTVASGGGLKRGNVGATDSASYNGADPEYGTGRDEKAKHVLSNGSEVWDMSGNVYEWTSDTIQVNQQPVAWDGTTDATGLGWSEYVGPGGRYLKEMPDGSPYSLDDFGPAGGYTADHGVGRIYHYSNVASTISRAVLRSGYWSNGTSTGVFLASLYFIPSDQYHNVGFRCASDPVEISQSYNPTGGIDGSGAQTVTIGDNADAKLYQPINVGDTQSYNLHVYVKNQTTGDGGVVDASVAQLLVDGERQETSYTDVGDGWYKLTGSIEGADEERQYGLVVSANKTIVVDDWRLASPSSGTYSVYTTTAYGNEAVKSWDSFEAVETTSGNSVVGYQLCVDDGAVCEANETWQFYDGEAWVTATNTTSDVNAAADLTQAAMRALPADSTKLAVKAIIQVGTAGTAVIESVTVGLTTDITPPESNASAISMTKTNGGYSIGQSGWTNSDSPYFSWTAGEDNAGGVGLKGYCLYLGTDESADPATSKGLLGESPVDITDTTCQFIAPTTSLDLSVAELKGDMWLTSSSEPYYLSIKAVDNSGNTYTGQSAQFAFHYGTTTPANVSYIFCASGSFSNVVDMSFSWPTDGSAAAIDEDVDILGWQYQINGTDGEWLGTETDANLGLNYIPANVSSYTLTQEQDGAAINSGNNIVYFRTVNAVGHTSTDATIRTCNLSFGGAAPTFGGADVVSISPSSSGENLFSLSWPAATATEGQSVAKYYYMVNTTPPSTLATLEGNDATYINNGTSTTVVAGALPNVNKGTNTVYVVAVDDANSPNYSPSNYISGTFTLNSTNPDNVGNVIASDSSIKAQEQWNVTLTWTAPAYQGAGNLTYVVQRSANGTNFSQVGTTTGLSYVDATPASAQYYYKIVTRDGANAQSSGTNAVAITPTGKWTTPPSIEGGPEVSNITTKRATIAWATSRSADSRVQFGTEKGAYGEVEPSNSTQTTAHAIELSGLEPSTTYYYRAKWTDEDGNTGISEERSFTTAPPPSVQEVVARNIDLDSAIIQFTSRNASGIKIYYGPTTSFGGVQEIATSSSETTYTVQLTGLADGAKYYYKINTLDSDGSEYEGTVLDFTTLPRPKISNVRIQQVANTAQSTILVSWDTNTATSSIISYYPEGSPDEVRDVVDVELVDGEHQMIVRSLAPHTTYLLVVKGRDAIGNEAVSDSQRVTTATDTRPAEISNVRVEGSVVPAVAATGQESSAQLVVSWNTDEPATSQVQFGEGSGSTYTAKTQLDENLTFNHLVVISGLEPSKVYHVQALSLDAAKNESQSVDTVTITPKATENALSLVLTSLQRIFGFLGSF